MPMQLGVACNMSVCVQKHVGEESSDDVGSASGSHPFPNASTYTFFPAGHPPSTACVPTFTSVSYRLGPMNRFGRFIPS